MPKYQMGQYVAAVDQKKFMDDLRDGRYHIAKIFAVVPSSVGGEENYLYRAKDEAGEIYCAFEKHINQGLYEFLDMESLANYLARFGREKLGEGYYLLEKAEEAKKYC